MKSKVNAFEGDHMHVLAVAHMKDLDPSPMARLTARLPDWGP